MDVAVFGRTRGLSLQVEARCLVSMNTVPRLAAVLLWFLQVLPVSASDREQSSEQWRRHGLEAARRYAPILWLATDERIYPMMPHPFAFDGIDNDSDGCFDLQDADEVGLDVGPQGKPLPADIMSGVVERLRYREFTLLRESSPVPETGDAVVHRDLREALAANGVWLAYPNATIRSVAFEKATLACKELWQEGRGAKFWEIYDSPAGLPTQRPVNCDEPLTPAVAHDSHEAPPIPRQSICLRTEGGNRLRVQRPDMLPPARISYRRAGDVREHAVHQYWTYYLFDEGSGGHSHDPEHYQAFVDPYEKLRAAVASAHAQDVSNNVLIVGRPYELEPRSAHGVHRDSLGDFAPIETRRLPQDLPRNMPLLVELGKHASAPDRDFNGRFEPGSDSNYNYRGTWGLRDIAAAVGADRLGKPTVDHSLPRDTTTLLPERCWLLAKATATLEFSEGGPGELMMADVQERVEEILRTPTAFSREQVLAAKIVGDGAQQKEKIDCRPESFRAELQRQPSDEALLWRHELAASSKFGPGKNAYELFPVHDMYELERLIKAGSKGAVKAFLEAHRDCFWGSAPGGSIDISEDAWAAMQSWPVEEGGFHKLSQHEDYRDPEAIFKSWLSPDIALRVGYVYRGDSLLRLGVQLAGMTVNPFPKKLGKVRLTPYSTWTPYVELQTRSLDLRAAGLNFDLFRGGHTGMFGGVAIGGIGGDGHVALTVGRVLIATTPKFLPARTRLSIRAAIRGEMHRALDLSHGSMEIGAQLDLPLKPHKHPLEY